ncbi:uncharacterized protein LOC133859668 isoform X1 [Alnus glutinosa]|uniref:uncharacterized protein LOC133859668 isoform X1 n=1 Tax=Alnus glutinosa TaxID=3517 RepID=UPI002D78D8F5|nr:uncharacterized protein LOC133859668 isoform X1 [Alnus glutinosa]
MKTILIICILFASLLFSPSSILARELAESSTGGNGQAGNPNKPVMPIKCDPKSSTYSRCIGQTKPEPKCNSYGAYTRCPGTGSSGTPNNPTVKPGTGSSGNPNNPAVKPGTGSSGNSNNPAVKPGTGSSRNPNNPAVKPGTGSFGNPNNPAVKPGTGDQPITKCDPKGPYTRCPQPKHKCDPKYKRCNNN